MPSFTHGVPSIVHAEVAKLRFATRCLKYEPGVMMTPRVSGHTLATICAAGAMARDVYSILYAWCSSVIDDAASTCHMVLLSASCHHQREGLIFRLYFATHEPRHSSATLM